MDFAEIRLQHVGSDRLIDTGRGKKGRNDVDMRGRRAFDRNTGRRVCTNASDREGHAGCLVVQGEPLLVQAAVGAEKVAVVGGAHDDAVVATLIDRGGDRTTNLIDRAVDLGMQPVVQVAIFLRLLRIGRCDCADRPVARRVRLTVRDLGRWLACKILVGGRRFRHMRWVKRASIERVTASRPCREEHDVVRVDEARHQQERTLCIGVTGGTSGVAIFEPVDDPFGDQGVASKPAVGEATAVRFGADPTVETKRVEWIRGAVLLDSRCINIALAVVGLDPAAIVRPANMVEVGVADVPLAVVVRVVARSTEPVAERRHFALGQPAEPRVVSHLAEPVGLRDAVDIGVLAGEDRWTTGHAGQRSGVVPVEVHSIVVKPPATAEGSAPPGKDIVRLVGRDGPLFVGHDDDHVGTRHACCSCSCPGCPGDVAKWVARPASISLDA